MRRARKRDTLALSEGIAIQARCLPHFNAK